MNHHDMGHANNKLEYLKFFGVLVAISVAAVLANNILDIGFLDAFMGAFFVVFASFKLAQLKEFAYGFQSYDLLAKQNLLYSYSYPFIQLAVGLLYLFGFGSILLDSFVVIISLVSGAGVLNSLIKKQAVHCVCLGNVIKLPLSRISFVEDFGMALMAIAMILMR